MTDKEKEAIEYFSREVNEKQWIESNFNVSERNKLRAILKFIKKQEKIIDLMSERLTTPIHSKEWVKRYYEEEVEGEEC